MNNDLQSDQLTVGMDIWFFQHPKDHAPTLQTTIEDIWEDGRGRISVEAKGIGEAFPIYHFKLPRPQPENYSSAKPFQEVDDLYKRSGI